MSGCRCGGGGGERGNLGVGLGLVVGLDVGVGVGVGLGVGLCLRVCVRACVCVCLLPMQVALRFADSCVQWYNNKTHTNRSISTLLVLPLFLPRPHS